MADLDQLSEISQGIRAHDLEGACKRFEQAVCFNKGHDEALLCFQDVQNRLRMITMKVDLIADGIIGPPINAPNLMKERAK